MLDTNNPLIIAGAQFLGIFLAFNAVLVLTAYLSLVERRVLAVMQGRLGPNRVGWFGLLQPLADGIKFIFKEDIAPDKATKFIYILAPFIAIISALMTLIVYPFGPTVTLPFGETLFGESVTFPMTVARMDVALLYVLAVTSVGVYAIALAGWSSNSKYSLMGGLRSAAQMISYELSLGLSLIGVILMSGTLDLFSIAEQQGGWFGMKWNIFFQPLGFFVYLISAIAETNRVPFDLPEAETELVAGFHTEYSAMKFALFFIAEYVNMTTVSMLAATLFLGGFQGPFVAELPILGPFYFVLKVFFFLFLYIWLRGTLPRFRFDQLMNFGWKFLLPVAILNIILTATIAVFFYSR